MDEKINDKRCVRLEGIKKFLRKNWISIIALLISGYVLYAEHLKHFDLKIEEGAAITIARYGDRYLLGLPVILINNGAQGGVVKKFNLRIKKNNLFLLPNDDHIFIEFKHILDLSNTQDSIPVIYLNGHGSYSLNIGRHLIGLTPGKYDCELIVSSPSNKEIIKMFYFVLDADRIATVSSGQIIQQQIF